MASSNTTLTSLWIDDAEGSGMKCVSGTPGKRATSNGAEIKEDVRQFYKDVGLEPDAKQVGLLDNNGTLTTVNSQYLQKQGIQLIAMPVQQVTPGKVKLEYPQQHILPASVATISSPMQLVSTPQRAALVQANTMLAHTPKSAQLIPIEPPNQWSTTVVRKRPGDYIDSDYSDGKRKKGEKGGKGLRHFSMKVCEKVQKKGITSYNEVADELVAEFTDPRNMTQSDQSYDQKNIRRRVYDALNVLMAMNIISKEKKEIKWIGLPTNSAQECQNLDVEKQRRLERIKHKTQQLQELILQQIAFKNLVQRNKGTEEREGMPMSNSAIQLPFIVVNTSKKTVIDCSISNDKYEYLFNFDNTFEIHDDIEVLKRMGMAYGLEKGRCTQGDLHRAVKMVPDALKPYVLELASVSVSSSVMAGPSTTHMGVGTSIVSASTPSSKTTSHMMLSDAQSPLAVPLPSGSYVDPTDLEVAMATGNAHHQVMMQHAVMSRQSSIASDLTSARATPSEGYSDSGSERSSPADIH